MQKDDPKVQNLVKPKTTSTSKSEISATCCQPKKDLNAITKKEVDLKKKELTVETKITSIIPKSYIRDKINDNKQQSTDTESSGSQGKKSDKISVFENTKPHGFFNIVRHEVCSVLPLSALENRPLVMAVHVVPSLPISLFELLAETIEAATSRPVVLLYESRVDRPVAKDLVDIAILSPSDDWNDGALLPASFVFEHRLNKEFQPGIYADVVVAIDQAPHVENVMDLRGYRCVLPDRRNSIGATRLLFNYLKSKGEGPSFFGDNLDVSSQLAALHMISSTQVEVGVVESPVIKYHRNYLPGMENLSIIASLGPLPPYRIMVHKDMPAPLVNKITSYLLKLKEDPTWMEKYASYSVLGFAPNSKSYYDFEEIKTVATDSPYY